MPSTLVSNVKEIKESLAKELPVNSLSEDSIERCQDMLGRLNEYDITLGILSETLIGTVVSKFKAHETLGPSAKALVKKWKKLAKQGGVSNNNTTSTSSSSSAKKPKANNNQSNTTSSSANADQEEWESLPPLRKNVCNKLHALLVMSKKELMKSGFNENAVATLCVSRASEVEEAVQTKFGREKQSYTEKVRSLCFNLKKNAPLRSQILMGQTPADALVVMSSEQLASSDKVQQRADLVNKLQDSRRLDWEQANEDKINEMCGIKGDLLQASLFTCGRCKSIKTTSTQKQTRSADEPMTVFVLCMNCGNRW
eukprot:CAMPEP_0195299748 /NCGR_PEP_ID=MMETSP0707-20130614/26102_1 /TAXON_ID=33640 /ORGANISM="Asterionellopsis glacialis, Strain CCMP134" /LENGTH=311 /DNA_ID=CAMNT_0040362227 /DNA_START=231 /DNA_END=1163 /DNA_ORIENTATION=-